MTIIGIGVQQILPQTGTGGQSANPAPDLLLQPKVGSFRALGFLQASAILRAADPVKAEFKEKLARLIGA